MPPRPISMVLSIGRHWGRADLRNRLELLQLRILYSNRTVDLLESDVG